MNKMKTFYLLILSFILVSWGMAQNDTTALKNEFKRLDATNLNKEKHAEKMQVVSASRSNKMVEDLPVTIYVISGEEIRRNGYATLTDALKSVPGIRTSKLGSGDLGETFLMRGLIGNSYCKILINNIPIQPVVTGSLPIGEQLPIAQAEQIEVVFGPAAAVYGADAMAGVINIITKKPKDSEFAHINFAKGPQGYRHFDFLAGGKLGRNKNVLSYTLFGNQTKRDDLNFDKQSEAFNTLNYAREYFQLDNFTEEQILAQGEVFFNAMKDAMPHYKGEFSMPEINEMPKRSYLIGTSLNYRNFELTVQEMYRQDHSSIGKMPVLYAYADPNTFVGETIQRTTLSYANRFEKLNFQTNLSYLRHRMNPNSALATNYNNGYDGKAYIYSASDDIFGEGILSYQMNEFIELTAGGSFLHASSLPTINEQGTPFKPSGYHPFDSTFRPAPNPIFGDFGYYPVLRTNLGAFFQTFIAWRKWTAILGMRYDKTHGYDDNSYNRLAVLYKISPKSSVRFSASSAVRAPTPDEQYISLAMNIEDSLSGEQSGILYQRVPNPNLKPETLNTIELGFRKRFSEKWDMEAILQLQYIQRFITPLQVPLDTLLYPNAISEVINQDITVRQYFNDSKSAAQLLEMQLLFRGRNIIPALKLDADIWLKMAGGTENLPQTGDQVQGAKMVPNGMIQLNISANPIKNLYFRAESQALSDWTRRYIADLETYETHKYARISGYFNLDVMASYKMNKNIDLYVRAVNVFNTKYAGLSATGLDVDLWFNPQPMRNIYFGINFNLN